ncbi:hypothetical protein BDR06DRAFT_990548 [Suillus hirtellus]|nr:hypothetical protein BDR06DRAFT_990548 [Suillus hirtellus]
MSDPTRPGNSAGIAFILNKEIINTTDAKMKILAHAGDIDFMMGDFNITEELIDRAPARHDHKSATKALRDLRSTLNLQDTWCLKNPNMRTFTFSSNHNTLSRLDRIYTSTCHLNSMTDWNSQISHILMDHHMVSTRFAPPRLPHIGRGRWLWPIGIMKDESLIKQIIKLGINKQQQMEEINI